MREYHLIQPVYNQDSRILILGSFPSVKSRAGNFFYHHPQNRFWKILSNLYNYQPLETIIEKKQFLLEHKIAVWDVIASCEITGSSDSSIKNITINDLEKIINESKITHSLPVTKLPSSSPANATYSLDKLINCWNVIKIDE